MKSKTSIIAIAALAGALSFTAPAYAQTAGASTSTDTQVGASAGTGTGTDAGASAGGSTSTDTGTSSGGTTTGGSTGTDTNAGASGGTTTTTTTDGANAGTDVNVDVSVEQQTEIRTAITQVKVSPVTVDFDLNIGVAVPTTVHLEPLPVRVVELVPQFKGFLFFVLADGRIVIVSPTTMKVVYILAV